MQKIAKMRGIKGAASWCALTAVLYLFCKYFLQGAASFLMGLKVKGASLADPAGFSRTAATLITLLVGILALAVPIVWLLKTTRLEVEDLRLLAPQAWSPAFCITMFLGVANLGNLAGGLLARLTGKTSTSSVLPAGGMDLLLSFVTLCILPALGEELLFRGALQGLMRPCGSAAAVFGPALLFALLHLDVAQGLTAFLCGMFLGWLAERTGSVLPGMLLHLLNNSIAFLDIYLQLYAPSGFAVGIEVAFLLLFPLAGAWLLYHAIRDQHFSFGDGMRPGVPALAVFQSPAYVIAAGVLLFYTVYLSLFA